MKSLRQNCCAVVFTSQNFTKRNLNFFVSIIISFTFLPVHVHSRVKGWISFLSFFFSLRASPYGWICGVVSTKTPTSIVLCLKNIALPKKFTPLKECNRMVKYQNGKVYKLLTKIRALLNVLCYLTSLLWSWRWAKSSWNYCVGKNHVCRIKNLHVMTVLMHFKQWWDKSAVQIGFISGQWHGSAAKTLNLFKLYALILLYKEAIDHWLQSCTGATN